MENEQNNGRPEWALLTDKKRKAVQWALELMGDCNGADTLKAMVERLPTAEASTALLRQALQRETAEAAVMREALRHALSDGDLIGKLAKSTKREIEEALEPGAGQSLLDHIKTLEEQVRLLTKERAELTEALRSMVTVYVGIIHDHFDKYTYDHVLEEQAVKRARDLLGLNQASAEMEKRHAAKGAAALDKPAGQAPERKE